MARKRIIDPEFWSDEEIGQWSFAARLFYIGLWNFADDSGRFKSANELLKAQIFPYEEKIDIGKLKKELKDKIQWYKINELQYGFIRNFLKYQRIDKPTISKLPPPPKFVEDSTNPPRILHEDSRLIEEKLREVNIREPFFVDFEKSTMEIWNSFCDKFPTLSKIQEITETRRKHLKERFTKNSFKDFNAIICALEKQPFLIKGNLNDINHKNWKVSFDWLIKNDTNYVKVLEMRYQDKTQSDIKAAAPDCKFCQGTGWVIADGGKRLCHCRINK